MAHSYLTIVVEQAAGDVPLAAKLLPAKAKTNRRGVMELAEYLTAVSASQPQARVFSVASRDAGAARASCFAECTLVPANNDTYTLCGLTFTFKTALSSPANPFEVLIGGSASAAMVNLTAAINANFLLAQIGSAVKSAPLAQRMTFTALMPGGWANDVIVQSAVSVNVSVSGAKATGGAQGPIADAVTVLGAGAALWNVGGV